MYEQLMRAWPAIDPRRFRRAGRTGVAPGSGEEPILEDAEAAGVDVGLPAGAPRREGAAVFRAALWAFAKETG